MANPTTVRLTPEREEFVEKMTALYGTRSAVINRAIDLLWISVGRQAKSAWSAIEKARESADATTGARAKAREERHNEPA